MTVSSIYKLLDKMEMMVLKGVPIPLTPWVVVNHEQVIDLLDKIRASVPGEIQEAHGIIKKRDEIYIDAQNKANQVISDARAEASRLISDSEILRAVQSEAERIRKEVIEDCERLKREAKSESERVRTTAVNEAISIREGADKYADSILANLDRDLSEMHNIVKTGQQQLAKIKAESISSMTVQRASISGTPNVAEFEEDEEIIAR